MTDSLKKLRSKLTEMFPLDQADLDFGIYRVMNLRRDEIVRFLDQDLLPQVRALLGESASAGRATKGAELKISRISAATTKPGKCGCSKKSSTNACGRIQNEYRPSQTE